MSSLENTIGEVIAEAADIQHKVPGKGDSAPAAMSSPDADAEKNASKAAKDAGDAVKPAKPTNKATSGDSMEVASDGTTKVDTGKAVNQEEIESDEDVVSEMADMTKSEMLKAAVEKMKEMSGKELQAMYSKMETSETSKDKDGEDDEMSESLSRNAIIRKVVESLKDQEISEVTNFMAELDNDSDEGDSKEKLKST